MDRSVSKSLKNISRDGFHRDRACNRVSSKPSDNSKLLIRLVKPRASDVVESIAEKYLSKSLVPSHLASSGHPGRFLSTSQDLPPPTGVHFEP